jgi:hypothetical protein
MLAMALSVSYAKVKPVSDDELSVHVKDTWLFDVAVADRLLGPLVAKLLKDKRRQQAAKRGLMGSPGSMWRSGNTAICVPHPSPTTPNEVILFL